MSTPQSLPPPEVPPQSTLPSPRDGLPTPRRYLAIAATALGSALVVIDGSIPNVALPTLARDLAVDASSAVLVVTVYQLVLVMALLPFSALGARIGLKRMYQMGQIVFMIAAILCFFARSLPFLLVVRVIQGLGAAAVLSVASALIRSIYPARQLGRGMAVNGVVVSSAAALAPTLGGLILAWASWPWIFAAAAPFAVLSLLVGYFALPEDQPTHEPYDVLGALLCAATFGLIVGGLESALHGDSPVVSWALVAMGVALAYVFVKRELQEPSPTLPVDLLARPVMALSVSASFISFIGSMAFTLSLPFRLEQYGYTPHEVGAMISAWPLAMLVMAPIGGMLADRFEAGMLGGIGMSIATVGLLSMAWLPAHPVHFDIMWRMALCGLGYGLFLAPNVRVIIGSAPIMRAASAGGLVSTTRFVGQALGATTLAALLAAGFGSGPVPAYMAAGITVLTGVLSVARLKTPRTVAPRDSASGSEG